MDDPADRGYSRAPEVEDLISLCKNLNENQVAYVLIGGFAVILHGSVRTTKDIDLLVDPSIPNVQRLKKVLGTLPDNAIAEITDTDVEKYEVVRIADEIVIDLMAKACGIDYAEAQSGIQLIEVEGVKIPVASKELLIRMKDTIRHSDKIDVEFLKWRIEEEKK
jgi:hypothetical protein